MCDARDLPHRCLGVTYASLVKENAGGRAVLFIVLVLVLMVGGGWAAAYHFASDTLPHGSVVAGVRVGDLTPTRAAARLRTTLAARAAQPITILAGGTPIRVLPAEAGLSFDAAATVASAASAPSWRPRDLWEHYTEGGDLTPVVRIDQIKLARTAARIDREAGRPARDGAISLAGAHVSVTEPVTGRAVDTHVLAEALQSAYLATGAGRRVHVPLHDVAPKVDEAAVEHAVDRVANPAMSGPVVLVFGRRPVLLAPRDYASALTLAPKDGALVPSLDRTRLEALVARGLARDHRHRVSYDVEDLATTFLDLITRPDGQRAARVTSAVVEPVRTGGSPGSGTGQSPAA